MEGAQSFVGLLHESFIVFEVMESHGVVDVVDVDAFIFQRLPVEDILIAVVLEALVEWMAQHDVALDHEVGRMKMGVGRLGAPSAVLLGKARHFVGLTEVASWVAVFFVDGIAPAYDVFVLIGEVGFQKGRRDGRHVAVDKQKVGVLGLLRQEIPDGRPPHVGVAHDVACVGQCRHRLVGTDCPRVGRPVVGHQYLENEALGGGGRLVERLHQVHTYIVVGGNQDAEI